MGPTGPKGDPGSPCLRCEPLQEDESRLESLLAVLTALITVLTFLIGYLTYRMDRRAAEQREALEKATREKEHRDMLSETITTKAAIQSRAAVLAYRYMKLRDQMQLRPRPGPQNEQELRERVEHRAASYQAMSKNASREIAALMDELKRASKDADVELRLHAQRITRAALGEDTEALIVDAEKEVAALPW